MVPLLHFLAWSLPPAATSAAPRTLRKLNNLVVCGALEAHWDGCRLLNRYRNLSSCYRPRCGSTVVTVWPPVNRASTAGARAAAADV